MVSVPSRGLVPWGLVDKILLWFAFLTQHCTQYSALITGPVVFFFFFPLGELHCLGRWLSENRSRSPHPPVPLQTVEVAVQSVLFSAHSAWDRMTISILLLVELMESIFNLFLRILKNPSKLLSKIDVRSFLWFSSCARELSVGRECFLNTLLMWG